MKIYKKATSCLLSGILCISAQAQPMANAIRTNTNITELKGFELLNTSCYTVHNSSKSPLDGHKAVYDMYVKVDTEGFSLKDTPSIKTPSDEKVTNVSAYIDNNDGSYIYADIIDFTPAQMDFLNVAFPVNGTYKLDVRTTTGGDMLYPVEVTEACFPYNQSDKTPPQLKVNIAQPDEYITINGLTVTITSDEVCYMRISGIEYKLSNSASCRVFSDGVYRVTATDVNGNTIEMPFTIDVFNKLTTTTTTKTTTTTTATTTTTTPPEKILYGDANCDTKVTIADAAAILQFLANPDKYKLNEKGVRNADCFDPGSGVTINDAISIQQFDAKIKLSLP